MDKQLNTIIQLRYGTYDQWMNSDVVLREGEPALCSFPNKQVIDSLSNTTPEHTPPAIGIKIGDGYHRFSGLPWVQAIAADVYNWAKESQKPTYNISEISGLQSYLEENYNLSGDITIVPRIYQIIQGENEDSNKYYLRYKEANEGNDWVTDTSHPIDLSVYAKIANWIGTLPNRYGSLGTFTAWQTGQLLTALSYDDENAVDNQFVTKVTQTNGIIEVDRTQPNFSNLTGHAEVSQGGTGKTSFPENEVLVGNETGAINTIPIAEEITNNNHLVPNYLIKSYVDNLIAGLSNAMHFVGEATTEIIPNSSTDPLISNYDFSAAHPGDVIIYEYKEYVWDGARWILLGDESSYAIKGSIVDADIADNANIQQSKIAGLSDAFDDKVDKVVGKMLTSNDFTDKLKQKLDDIESGAQKNTIEHILVNNTEVLPVTNEILTNAVNLIIKEFTDEAKEKLQEIEPEAQVNKIEKIIYDGEEIIPDENRVVSITSDPHTDHINKIESIFINGVEWVPNADKEVKIVMDQAALNLNVLEGATIPPEEGNMREEINQVNKKLELERIAVTGNVSDLHQTRNTYIILNCGSSTEVID